MIVKILGPGCTNCKKLERVTRDALAELGLEAEVEKVEDYAEISRYGVMSTPGLVVDDRVLVSGRVPRPAEIQQLLAEARDAQPKRPEM